MRQYECMYIIRPEVNEENHSSLVEKFKAVVNDNSGEVTKIDLMGKRRLAYEIQKLREGQYVLMYFNGTNNAVSELNRVIGITDDVIRHIIVRHE